MAAVGQFWAMTPSDVYSVDEWLRFGKDLCTTAEWMLFASLKHAQELNMSQDFMYCLIFGVISGIGIILYNIYYPGEAFDYSTDAMSSDDLKAEIAKLKEEEKVFQADEAKRAAAAGADTSEPDSKDGLRQRKGKSKGKASENKQGGEVVEGRSDQELYAEAKDRVMEAKLAQVDQAAENMRGNEKLRKLLGVNDEELEKVVSKTKNDVRMGVTPSEPTNIGAWFDTFFFLAMAGVLLYFANRDYGFNALFWLEQHFPREAKVIKAFSGK
jgi:hypothetical protein